MRHSNFLSLGILPVPILTAFCNNNRGLFPEVQPDLFPHKEGLSVKILLQLLGPTNRTFLVKKCPSKNHKSGLSQVRPKGIPTTYLHDSYITFQTGF